jgi:hypothetical protein
MTDLSEMLMDAITVRMVKMNDEERMTMLQAVDNTHVAAFVTWITLEQVDHENCGENCAFKNMEHVTESYINQFASALRKSVSATCEANGMEYAPDPNKEVRDEILAESNS